MKTEYLLALREREKLMYDQNLEAEKQKKKVVRFSFNGVFAVFLSLKLLCFFCFRHFVWLAKNDKWILLLGKI